MSLFQNYSNNRNVCSKAVSWGQFHRRLLKAFPRTRRSWLLFTDALASPLVDPRRMSSESLVCSRLLIYPQKPPKNFIQHTFLNYFTGVLEEAQIISYEGRRKDPCYFLFVLPFLFITYYLLFC
jgi:hypothetical protein